MYKVFFLLYYYLRVKNIDYIREIDKRTTVYQASEMSVDIVVTDSLILTDSIIQRASEADAACVSHQLEVAMYNCISSITYNSPHMKSPYTAGDGTYDKKIKII